MTRLLVLLFLMPLCAPAWSSPDPTTIVREIPLAISAEEYLVISTRLDTPAVHGASTESMSLAWYGLEDNKLRESVLLHKVERTLDRLTDKTMLEEYWNPSASIAEALTRFSGQLMTPPVRQRLTFQIDELGVYLMRNDKRVDVLSASVLAERIERFPTWLEFGELIVVGMHKEVLEEPRYLIVVRSQGRIDDGSSLEVVLSLP